MFADAVESAHSFTKPFVVSFHRSDGRCGTMIGAYVIVNSDGWAATAAHLFEKWAEMIAESASYQETESRRIEISATIGDKKERSRLLRELPKFTTDAVTHTSAWIGLADGTQVLENRGIKWLDLAFFRFDPAALPPDIRYPVFKNPASGVKQGTSLCRLGYPFHGIEPSFDAAANTFQLPPGATPLPTFPIDGIFAREIPVEIPGVPNPPFPMRLLGTSSPGLMGQSGGPIFDMKGRVWGIQSQTQHIPLGFNPPVPGGRKGEVEHQFLNLGIGTHPVSLVGAMLDAGIRFEMSDD